jgi:hypothetical protein
VHSEITSAAASADTLLSRSPQLNNCWTLAGLTEGKEAAKEAVPEGHATSLSFCTATLKSSLEDHNRAEKAPPRPLCLVFV